MRGYAESEFAACWWTDAVMLLVKTPGRCNSAESQLLAEPVSYTVRGAPDGVTRGVKFTPRVTPGFDLGACWWSRWISAVSG